MEVEDIWLVIFVVGVMRTETRKADRDQLSVIGHHGTS